MSSELSELECLKEIEGRAKKLPHNFLRDIEKNTKKALSPSNKHLPLPICYYVNYV